MCWDTRQLGLQWPGYWTKGIWVENLRNACDWLQQRIQVETIGQQNSKGNQMWSLPKTLSGCSWQNNFGNSVLTSTVPTGNFCIQSFKTSTPKPPSFLCLCFGNRKNKIVLCAHHVYKHTHNHFETLTKLSCLEITFFYKMRLGLHYFTCL